MISLSNSDPKNVDPDDDFFEDEEIEPAPTKEA